MAGLNIFIYSGKIKLFGQLPRGRWSISPWSIVVYYSRKRLHEGIIDYSLLIIAAADRKLFSSDALSL
jgi:hypothetical protein